MKVIHHVNVLQIFFENFITRRGATSVLKHQAVRMPSTHPCSHQSSLSLSYSVKLSCAEGIQSSFSSNSGSLQECGRNPFSPTFLSTEQVSVLHQPVRFPSASFRFYFSVPFSLDSTAITTIAIPTLLSERALVNWTLMGSCLQVMKNEENLNQINLQALEFSEFLDWLRDADTPSACQFVLVITVEAARRVQGRSGTAN